MKPTDFAKYLTDFLSIYLVGQKNASKNTIYSYRDTFKLLLEYCQKVKSVAIERISIDFFTAEVIKKFLEWLESDRKCSISTRNQRLASIHSFFRYVQSQEPSGIFHFQKVIAIPAKKAKKKVVEYLSPELLKLILNQPDKTSAKGRRDLTLLSLLYDTGARVQELIDIMINDITLDATPVISLRGKGNKIRRIPLMRNTRMLLETYLSENKLDKSWKNKYPLFTNNQHHKLTKEGIAYILNKYVERARDISSVIPKKISPHVFRHSKAMHLLQAGVNLI